MALLKEKHYEEAQQQFREAVQLAPKSAVAHAGLGAAEVGLGNVDEAAAQLRAAKQIDPQNLLAQKQARTLSQLQAEQQQQLDAAAPAARTFQSCDPNWSPRFDSIPGGVDPAGMRAQIQQLDGYVSQNGGFDGAIRQVETDNATNQANNDLSDDQVEALNLLSQGLIDILKCRQSMAQTNSGPSTPGPTRTYSPGAGDSNSARKIKTYTPGGSRSNDDSPGVYVPGAPTADTSMGMLDTGGNLKQAFVGMSSDYSAVNEQNHSSCDATVHVILLSSQLSGNGATLQFKSSVQPNPSSPAVPTGCFELEYTIEATQRMTNGDPGPAAGQTFQTQFADASDTANIELPVASTGSNGIDLIGWRVIGALCHTGGKCVKQVSSEQCAELEDYKNNELPNQMMKLIKSYGITTLNRDAAVNLQNDLSQDVSDIDQAVFLDHLKILVDETNDLAAIFSPEGELSHLAVVLGPKPSLTSRDVWKYIVQPQKNLQDAKEAIKDAVNDNYEGFVIDLIAHWSPIVGLVKDITQDAQEIHKLRTLSGELQGKVVALEAAIDAYNQALQGTVNQVNEIKQVSDGIDMACGGNDSSEPNQ